MSVPVSHPCRGHRGRLRSPTPKNSTCKEQPNHHNNNKLAVCVRRPTARTSTGHQLSSGLAKERVDPNPQCPYSGCSNFNWPSPQKCEIHHLRVRVPTAPTLTGLPASSDLATELRHSQPVSVILLLKLQLAFQRLKWPCIEDKQSNPRDRLTIA